MDWDEEKDELLVQAYNESKTQFWKGVARTIGDEGAWKQMEDRAWELGAKRMVKKGWV